MALANWTRRDPVLGSRVNYMGDDLSGLKVVPVSRNRDTGPMDESNFETALARLGGESETVQIHRFGHWACGWYELLLVDPSDATARAEAERIARDLERYPLLDEDDASRREYEEMSECWE